MFKELMELDKKVKAKQQFKAGQTSYSKVMEGIDDDENDSPDVDKRLKMYRAMR